MDKKEIQKWFKQASLCVHNIIQIDNIHDLKINNDNYKIDKKLINYDVILEQLKYLLSTGKEYMDYEMLSDMHNVISIVYDHYLGWDRTGQLELFRDDIFTLLKIISKVANKLGYKMYVQEAETLVEAYRIIFVSDMLDDKFMFG